MGQVLRLFFIFAVVVTALVKLVGAHFNDFIGIRDLFPRGEGFSERSYFADDEVFVRSALSSEMKQRGIREIIGTGKSFFPHSSAARLKNIAVATDRFNGVVVPQGAVFSFNEILESVHPRYGYVKEAVIKGGRTVYEQGGGLCQLSTTIFRAALSAGLEMVSQRGHSLAVPYYQPYGLESAIYMPYLDLRFRNNTPGDLLIQTRLREEELFVVFLGTSDGRKVVLEGPFYNKYANDIEGLKEMMPEDPYSTGFDYRRFSVQWIWKVEYPDETVEKILTSSYRGAL